MRYFFATIMAFVTWAACAQTALRPGKRSFEKKWIKNSQYQMTWYALRDTARSEMGTVSTQVLAGNGRLTIVTQVSMKNMRSPWIDSSVAELADLKPLYHSSYNMQRDMVLNFGPVVTGYYNDKMKKTNTIVNDTVNTGYFDSNLYPYLVGLLPLKEGYQEEILIYDYNPSSKIGVIKAFVKEVKSGSFQSQNAGTRDVWVVTVSDEIGNGGNGTSTYYFDKTDRKLWKQEINAGGRKMMMLAKE